MSADAPAPTATAQSLDELTQMTDDPSSIGVKSALLVTPRWARDGGVGAHVAASAAALAAKGIGVTVLAARVESEVRISGVTLCQQSELCETGASFESRVGEALAARP